MKNINTLLHLLSDGHFHSGQALADTLHISRTAVWKQIQQCEQLGLQVYKVRGKGYCIPGGIDLLALDAIRRRIDSQHLNRIELLTQVDSTNTYLGNKARLSSGDVCITEQQIAGRGRHGKTWLSPFAKNIALSIAWEFLAGTVQLQGLSLVVGIAVAEVLQHLGLDNIGLKWPNDIYFEQKKLGGILVDVSGDAEGPCFAIIGVGVNIDMPAQLGGTIDQAWTDLASILSPMPSRNELCALVINNVLNHLDTFSQQGLAAYLSSWANYDVLKDQQVEVLIGQTKRTGGVLGVNEQGHILIRHDDTVSAYNTGQVSIIRM